MKIFGKEFKTKKELRMEISALKHELGDMKEAFPFDFGQTVYDIQLKDEKGRYTKESASLTHSVISEVVVDTKNYFGLVERYHNKDVFLDYYSAVAYLAEVCVKTQDNLI